MGATILWGPEPISFGQDSFDSGREGLGLDRLFQDTILPNAKFGQLAELVFFERFCEDEDGKSAEHLFDEGDAFGGADPRHVIAQDDQIEGFGGLIQALQRTATVRDDVDLEVGVVEEDTGKNHRRNGIFRQEDSGQDRNRGIGDGGFEDVLI